MWCKVNKHTDPVKFRNSQDNTNNRKDETTKKKTYGVTRNLLRFYVIPKLGIQQVGIPLLSSYTPTNEKCRGNARMHITIWPGACTRCSWYRPQISSIIQFDGAMRPEETQNYPTMEYFPKRFVMLDLIHRIAWFSPTRPFIWAIRFSTNIVVNLQSGISISLTHIILYSGTSTETLFFATTLFWQRKLFSEHLDAQTGPDKWEHNRLTHYWCTDYLWRHNYVFCVNCWKGKRTTNYNISYLLLHFNYLIYL